MSSKNQVTLTFAGDADKLERTFARVGLASNKLAGNVNNSFKDGIDAAGRMAAPAAVASAGLLGAAMAPALAAGLAGGVVLALGGGVLAAGIIAASKSPAVTSAFEGMAGRAKTALAGFSKPFEQPLVRAADTFGDAIERMAPTITALGAKFAPLVDRLAPAIAKMAENALPGIASAAERAAPAFQMLADVLPGIGRWVGDLVGKFGELAAWGVRNRESIGQFLSVAAPMVGIFIGIIAAIKVWIAVQTALNVVMALNPIGLVIIAIAALVAIVVVIATKTTWFQDLWRVTWTFVKDKASQVWDWLKGLPDRIGSAFSRIGGLISAPFRAAFNMVSDAWNRTIGRLSWTVPGWVPGVGGNSISAPKLPKFHNGGTVPGAPGSEMLAILQAGEKVTPAGQGAATVLEIHSGGSRLDDLLVEILSNAVRVRGGSVQLVLGTGRG